MDILTHTLSGLAAGSVVAGFSKKGFTSKAGIIAAAGFGGALPDIDAVSLWSNFDATIGRLFHLTHPGNVIYSEKFWYSHHGFFHSLFAALLLAAITGAIGYLIRIKFRFKRAGFKDFIKHCGSLKLLFIGFISGYLMHLLGDIPTPASTWGGIRLFWPAETYVGGTGQIWWWNNYDIFLIALTVFIAGLVLLVADRFAGFRLNKIITGIFIVGFALCIIQINTRDYDFAYTGHTDEYQEFETESKEQQSEILGDRLYNAMEKFDKKSPFYF